MGTWGRGDRKRKPMTTNVLSIPLLPSLSSARRALFPRAAFWAIFLSLFFAIVYGWSNAYTHERFLAGGAVRTFYFEWERRIPFVPAFIVPYMSIDLFFFAAPFLCTDRREMRTHAKRVLLAIAI